MTETAQRKPVPKPGHRLPVSTLVLWGGLALGTFLAVEALTHGVMLPGLGGYLGAALTFMLFLAAGPVLVELIRRHHRAAASHAVRYGKVGTSAAYQGTRRHGARGAGFIAGHAKAQWAARRGGVRDETDPPPLSAEWDIDPSSANRSGNSTEGTAMTDEHHSEGIDPIFWGRQPGSGTRPAPRGRRPAANGTVPGAWGAVVAHTADFQAESDGDLLNWMRGQAIGAQAYAEALVEQYETCRNVIGLDPVAIQTIHDAADAATTQAVTMAAAVKKFAEHYELPTQFVADGGLLAHDGRWHKGDDS